MTVQNSSATAHAEQQPTISALAARPDANSIAHWLTAQVATRLRLDPKTIEAEEDLSCYGVDSLMCITLVCDLEQWLNCKLEDTLVFDYPTIGGLARYLSDARQT